MAKKSTLGWFGVFLSVIIVWSPADGESSVSVFPPSCPSVKTQAQAVRPAAGAHLNTYGEPQECLRRLATKFFKQEKINKS